MSQLLSCLMTSKPSRWGCLQRAILDFAAQDYRDRELVIVVGEVAYAGNIQSFLAKNSIAAQGVSVYHRPAVRSAKDGYLYALCQARGDYITLWDDANLNLPTRLSSQMEQQLKHPNAMTALLRGMYVFYETAELYVVDFEQPNAKPSERCCVSTTIVPRHLMPQIDHSFGRSPVAQLVDTADRNNLRLVLLPGHDFSHIVGVVGDEMRKEHRKLATELEGVRNVAWLQEHAKELCAALDCYSWPGRPAVTGPDGVAFEYEPKRYWEELYPVKVHEPVGVEKIHEQLGTDQKV